MKHHGEKAEALFRQGYNCAQSVLLAFGDLTGLDERTAAMVSSSFGGGLGRMREVCGAVSGAAMALGLLRGFDNPADRDGKKENYRLVRGLAERFREENGSILCRELLSGVQTAPGGDPEKRSEEYYHKRPCAELCRQAAELVDEILSETEPG